MIHTVQVYKIPYLLRRGVLYKGGDVRKLKCAHMCRTMLRHAFLLCLYGALFDWQDLAAEGAMFRMRGRTSVALDAHASETTAMSGSEGVTQVKPKLDPEFQAEIDKLDATQAKVREAMSVQRDALAEKKEALHVIQEQERDAQSKVDEAASWLERAQDSINKIDSQKQAVHVRFDLKRLRPLVGIAAEKKKKLIIIYLHYF